MARIGSFVIAAVLLGSAVLVGCSSEEHEEALAYDQAKVAGEDANRNDFHVNLAFASRSTEKDWQRDKDLEFRIRKNSEVRARATFVGATPGKTYSIHLVWIRPDGEELFRRYAEATVSAADSGGYDASVVYRKAEVIFERKTDAQHNDKPSFSVESILDISRAKNRETGEYLLRIYLDRRLLKEETVTIVGS